jgi:hypothetical protein
MTEKHLIAFLLGYGLMFTLHYLLEPTWQPGEPRPRSLRAIFNYTVGTAGISISFLYIHPELLLDVLVSISGAAIATVMAHSRDWVAKLVNRDRANGLIEESQKDS